MTRPNIWIVLLLASVLLNGVLLGVGARTWFGPGEQASVEMRAPSAGRGGFSMRAFMRALPPEMRDSARMRIEQERAQLRELARESWRARRDAYAVIADEPFDSERVLTALADARAARARLEHHTEVVILDIVAQMEPEARSEALRASMRSGRRPDRRRGEGAQDGGSR
jgi:uncharacterized membrane protein